MGETTATRRRRQVRPDRGPTLHDVARAAGVSTASASRALSRPDLVSEDFRDRVLAAKQTLAYVPNAAAQVLSGRPARLVGALALTLDDPLTVFGLEALTRGLAVGGVALIFMIAGDRRNAMVECVRSLLARGAGAIVFCGDATPIELQDLFPNRSVPCVSLDEPGTMAASPRSGFDRAKALALAARYLQQLGHGQIGFFAIGRERRISAVHRALASAGMGVVDDLSVDNLNLGNSAAAVLDHWLSLSTPPTGLVCGSDAAAVAMLHECKRREIEVPAQLSVIGFGDTDLSRQARPTLSTLRVPAREAGAAMARSLLATLDGRPEAPTELFAKLVARESTGPRHA